eukprot:RCo025203
MPHSAPCMSSFRGPVLHFSSIRPFLVPQFHVFLCLLFDIVPQTCSPISLQSLLSVFDTHLYSPLIHIYHSTNPPPSLPLSTNTCAPAQHTVFGLRCQWYSCAPVFHIRSPAPPLVEQVRILTGLT